MATQAEIQALIDQIIPKADFPAEKMNPLLNALLDFASSGQTLVYPDLVADNTTMEDTTLVLNYGVNIITTSTPTNFACRLPIPITGKRVVVVNKSLMTVYLFPSMDGGQINNNPVNEPAIIPPDGAVYDFICVENPLPGAWAWSAPATNQYDSGEITVTTTTDVFSLNIAASNSNYAAERTGSFSSPGEAYGGINNSLYPQPPVPTEALPNSLWIPSFKPPVAWNAITKVKIYTNIIPVSGSEPTALLLEGSSTNTYNAGTFNQINPSAAAPGGAGNFGPSSISLDNAVPGSASAGLATNVGDPATVWGEYSGAFVSQGVSFVGDKFISTDGTIDTWFTRYLTLYLKPRVVGVVKFRFFIEYY